MNTYILNVKIHVDEKDDFDARRAAKQIIADMNYPPNTELKLQRIYDNRAPRKIDLLMGE